MTTVEEVTMTIYQIQARVRWVNAEGEQVFRGVPTFHFDNRTIGVIGAQQAAEYALKMLMTINPDCTASVEAIAVDSEPLDHASLGGCGWCSTPRVATDPKHLCRKHRTEYYAPQEG